MRAIRNRWFFIAASLCATWLAAGAQAGSVTYLIDVNTSGLKGTSGYLDLQFDPGATPFDAGSATITGFLSDGTLGAALPDLGAVSGTLPGTVVIDNSDLPNEYTQPFSYGTYFDLFVTLDIPNVSGTATGGSSFTLDVEDSNFNPLLSSSFPAVEIDLSAATGNPTVSNNTGTGNTNGYATVTALPEPGTCAMFAAGLALVVWMRRGRRKAGAQTLHAAGN